MTTIEQFFETAARLGPRTAWSWRGRDTTFAEAAALVRRAARGLIALGVAPGEAVNIIGPNRPEWVAADLAALACGAVPAPIYPTLTAQQARFIADHSGARVAVCGDAALAAKLSRSESVLFDGFEELLRRGDAVPASALDERLARLRSRDLATLIYTSGTTGEPKGVMLSHANLAFAAERALQLLGTTPDDSVVSYLPLSHIAEQMITIHGPALSGMRVTFCDALDALPAALRAARPTIFFAVPRVWEKVEARVVEQVAGGSPLRRRLFAWAQRSHGRAARMLVHRKLRRSLGLDRARVCASGAAKLGRATQEFFGSLGIEILDIFGMTESTATCSANLPGAHRRGTVGRPVTGCEVRIADDGEILVRGANVFLGYLKDEAATREALDAEGFLHTGDVGALDADGFLQITDRKKELLVTSGGKNVSPQSLEAQLVRIAGIAQAVVVGDARKYLAALLVPVEPRLARDAEFAARIEREIAALNTRLASFETIKMFRLLEEPFSVESGELTPTLKPRRKAIAARRRDEIEALFPESRTKV